MNVIKKLVSGSLRAHATGAVTHPDPDALSAFAENALSGDEHQEVVAHLEQCADCREVLFLSLPAQTDHQRVLVLPPQRSRLAFRWGTLAAAIAIGAVIIVSSRHKQPERNIVVQTPAPWPAAAPTQIAKEVTPPELDQVQKAQDKVATVKAASPIGSNGKKLVPNPKHATAVPESPVAFDSGDQVRVDGTVSRDVNVPTVSVPQQVPSTAAPAAVMVERQKDQVEAAKAEIPIHGGGAMGAAIGAIARHGHLAGSVTDPSGATVANAVVTTSGPFGTQTVLSDQTGKFSFDDLTAGKYSLRAQASGFRAFELTQLTVANDKISDLRLTLQPGAAAETVEVTAQAVMPTVTNMVELETASKSAKAKAHESSRTAALTVANSATLAKSVAVPILQWTLSPEGHLERSLDLGRTWEAVAVPGGNVFRALSSVGTHVWAGGKQGLLLHSVDSGRTWDRVTPTSSEQALSSDIVRVDFTDASSGTVSTSDGEFWVTADAGLTWIKH